MKRLRNSTSVFFLLFFLAACVGPSPEDTADTIYYGGKILTMAPSVKTVEAVAVQDGAIIAVGSQQQVLRHRGKNTQLLDLGGNTLMPGFIDTQGRFSAIVHVAAFGDLLPRGAKSMQPSALVFPAGRDEAAAMKALGKVQHQYAAMGYTTIRDSASHVQDIALFRKASYQEKLFLDLVAYPAIRELPQLLKQHVVKTEYGLQLYGSPQYEFDGYLGNFRMGGLAAGMRDLEAYGGLLGQLQQYRIPVWVDADAHSLDRFIDSARALGVEKCAYKRDRVVQTPFQSPGQVSDWFALGLSTAFVSEKPFTTGSTHRESIGPGDPLRLLQQVLAHEAPGFRGDDARDRLYGFLKALTIDAAYLHNEDLIKGSIEYGKLADFVVIEGDLTAAYEPAADRLRILQTIKEGKVVYQATVF